MGLGHFLSQIQKLDSFIDPILPSSSHPPSLPPTCRLYLRFLDRHEPVTIKRDKSGKKCRKTVKHKVPALKFETK